MLFNQRSVMHILSGVDRKYYIDVTSKAITTTSSFNKRCFLSWRQSFLGRRLRIIAPSSALLFTVVSSI